MADPQACDPRAWPFSSVETLGCLRETLHWGRQGMQEPDGFRQTQAGQRSEQGRTGGVPAQGPAGGLPP